VAAGGPEEERVFGEPLKKRRRNVERHNTSTEKCNYIMPFLVTFLHSHWI
jgi:hypothetical protein